MTLKLKAIVAAAVAAFAVSGAANAAYNASGTGDSSLFLSIIDTAGFTSAVFDLGDTFSYLDLKDSASTTVGAGTGVNASGFSNTWNVSTGDYAAAWSSISSVLSQPGTFWAIYAGDSGAAGGRGWVTTLNGTTPIVPTATNFNTASGNFNSTLLAQATDVTAVQNHTTVADGASYKAGATGAYAGFGTGYGANGKINGQGAVTWGNVGSTLNVVSLVNPLGTGGTVTPTLFQNEGGLTTFTLSSNGVLTLQAATVAAAVPEADAMGMMLAGLGLMGFVARRRKQA